LPVDNHRGSRATADTQIEDRVVTGFAMENRAYRFRTNATASGPEAPPYNRRKSIHWRVTAALHFAAVS
jgi:hypothetical protein